MVTDTDDWEQFNSNRILSVSSPSPFKSLMLAESTRLTMNGGDSQRIRRFVVTSFYLPILLIVSSLHFLHCLPQKQHLPDTFLIRPVGDNNASIKPPPLPVPEFKFKRWTKIVGDLVSFLSCSQISISLLTIPTSYEYINRYYNHNFKSRKSNEFQIFKWWINVSEKVNIDSFLKNDWLFDLIH